MGTEIESDNIPLLDWLCRSVIHQMSVKSVSFLADKMAQVRVDLRSHYTLTFA